MVSLYDLIINELKYRMMVHAERFGAFYTVSLGSHLFNLANKGEFEYDEWGEELPSPGSTDALRTGAKTIDTRLHTMFVAPPGFGKTYFIEQFVEGPYSIIPQRLFYPNEMWSIPCKLALNTTGPGFTGTIREGPTQTDDQGRSRLQGVSRQGLAQRYSTGILGFDEFSDLTEMMKRKHSRNLDTALLRALDSGIMTRDMAAGEIEYRTSVSLWAGTQPERFDMSSGLARRLLFLRFTPTKQDQEDIRWAMRKSISMRYQPDNIKVIHRGIEKIRSKVWTVKHAEFDHEIYDFIDHIRHTRDIRILHPDEIPIYRVVVGYWIMKHDFWEGGNELHMTLNDELKQLIEQEILWRWSVKRGGEFGEVEMILAEDYLKHKEAYPKKPYRGMDVRDLQKELINFGLDLSTSRKRILAFKQTGEIYFHMKGKEINRVILTRLDDEKTKPNLDDIFGNDHDKYLNK